MIETIEFGGKSYPAFQASGNAARFIMPFALELCKGVGVDVGCGKLEWALPGATPIDPKINDNHYHALYIGKSTDRFDYIFSSHCLEHIVNWVDTLDYWTTMLKPGGVVFLYLPHYSQEYWRPWNNRKHFNIFTPEILVDYFKAGPYSNVYSTGVDLNNSFAVVAQKNGRPVPLVDMINIAAPKPSLPGS